jgi:hypothetical protein
MKKIRFLNLLRTINNVDKISNIRILRRVSWKEINVRE